MRWKFWIWKISIGGIQCQFLKWSWSSRVSKCNTSIPNNIFSCSNLCAFRALVQISVSLRPQERYCLDSSSCSFRKETGRASFRKGRGNQSICFTIFVSNNSLRATLTPLFVWAERTSIVFKRRAFFETEGAPHRFQSCWESILFVRVSY